MPDRSHDHLIQEPRIRRIVRRPTGPAAPSVPAPRREETPPAPRVPAPRTPQRDGHLGHVPASPGRSGA